MIKSVRFIQFAETAEAKRLRKEGLYSIHLKNIIESIEQDPDPFFFGSYNWYYTGGNLEILPLEDNTDVLLHTSGANGNVLSKFLAIQFSPCICTIFHISNFVQIFRC